MVVLLGDYWVGKQSILCIATGKDYYDQTICPKSGELTTDSHTHPITIKFEKIYDNPLFN